MKRTRSHEEIVRFGEGFMKMCQMEIEANKLDIEYFNLLVNKNNKFNEALYKKIEECIEMKSEPDVDLYSNNYGEPIQTISEMIEVARGREKAQGLRWSATRLQMSLMDERAEYDYAYESGFALGMKESGLKLKEISRKMGRSEEKTSDMISWAERNK